MELFIQIRNGQPFEHPILSDNFKQAHPNIDTNNLPPEFAKFVRIEAPKVGLYKVLEPVTYEFIDGVWTDVFRERNMTQEEKEAFQQITKDDWASRPFAENFTAWVYDETSNSFKPPIPKPEVGKYFWQGTTNSWQPRPEYPTDGKNYIFDFATASWIEVIPS